MRGKAAKAMDTVAMKETRIAALSILASMLGTTLAISALALNSWLLLFGALLMYGAVPILGMLYCSMGERK